MKKLTLIAALASALSTAPVMSANFITIGTGGQTGVYYQVGLAVCKLINAGKDKHNIECKAPSTGGSVDNINSIKAGQIQFGVAQSDVQYQAAKGEGQFETAGADADLRAVFSLHPEPFTVVARSEANINTFDDLKGKRVNIGNAGSGQRSTMERVMEAKGWKMADLGLAGDLKSAEQSQALCDNQYDAIIFTVGHPNGSITEATTSCDTKLIPVTGAEIDKLVADNTYYTKATIPGKMYKGTDADTETFGVGATLVTSAKVSDDEVYQLTKAVFDDFEKFKKLHPAFANLKEADMTKNMLSAPLHPGAEKYYKEKGWM
ncbi:TAXI family TRAP transporter solute-binding subunit [Thiofilum flexile]|uniref:TAXI family TRAP transporter solute-binding subunit n=1 Tax=Thiofilum flexile TaxID=125627 RepID=UPI000374D32A|nr:TAXI family TRAP transporter solute-binding subunit [Thiofilum flexile]